MWTAQLSRGFGLFPCEGSIFLDAFIFGGFTFVGVVVLFVVFPEPFLVVFVGKGFFESEVVNSGYGGCVGEIVYESFDEMHVWVDAVFDC